MRARITLALASAAVLPLASPALAQSADSDEIVVTAQKRAESLRSVPLSVTAVTDDMLERLQADSLEDYAGRIPGMIATGTQPGNSRLVLRGLNNEGIGASVATYVDETPFGSSSSLVNAAALALDLDPFDIERIEVLRGPQGTLYGANSMGGLIKYVTRDPSFDDYQLRVRTTAESTEEGEASWAARGAVNIPLGDQAGLRVSGFTRSTGGFIDSFQDTNGNETFDPGEPLSSDDNPVDAYGVRATFLLQATDDLSFRISATTQDIDSENFGTVHYDVTGLNGSVAGPTYGDLLRLGPDFPLVSDTGYRIVNGTVNWDLGWASLVSSTSYGELDQFRLQGSNLQRLDQDVLQDKFTQEVRLASPSSDDLEWMLGFYYTRENGLIHQNLDFSGVVEALGFTPVLASILGITEPEVLALSVINLDLDSVYSETAVFGAATYHFSPQFDVSVGARFSKNDQEFAQIVRHTPVSAFLFGSINSGGESSSEDVTTYSIAPRWRINDDTMIYGRVASGFRPGGPNVLVAGSSIPATFGSDTLVNYELGVKADLIDNLIRVDAAVFHIDWKDVQLLFAETTPTGTTVSGNANGGNAVSRGVEWSVTLTPVEGFSVLWTGAYTDATLDGDPPPGAALRMQDGDSLPFSPEWASSIDVDYEWTVFGDTSAYVGAGARYVGEQMSTFATRFAAPDELRQVELPSYTVVDLRAGLRFDAFTVELFGRNMSDERGPTRITATAPTTPEEAAVLRPRTIGVTLTAEF